VDQFGSNRQSHLFEVEGRTPLLLLEAPFGLISARLFLLHLTLGGGFCFRREVGARKGVQQFDQAEGLDREELTGWIHTLSTEGDMKRLLHLDCIVDASSDGHAEW
jgi:hypothetical protein